MARACSAWCVTATRRRAPILITGCRGETDELVRQVLGEGADAVCYKPFDVPKLLTTLQQLAGK